MSSPTWRGCRCSRSCRDSTWSRTSRWDLARSPLTTLPKTPEQLPRAIPNCNGSSPMLKAKAAVVTGSTSGIGLGIARALGEQGANIMLNGFGDRKAIETLMAELRAQYHVEVDYSAADMARPGEVSEMIEQCVARFGSVDILANNAGIQHTAPVEEFPMDKWDQIL